IDNFGDIGVSWYLARQLHEEYAAEVYLRADDLQSLGRLQHLRALEEQELLVHQRIQLHRWHRDRTLPEASLRILESAEVLIEAFACTLPDELLSCMASSSPAPLWFNLDYLSAESWVRDCHLLDSP